MDFDQIDALLLEQKGKIIHQVWFGTMPNKKAAAKDFEKMAKYRNSWKEKNPNWLHHIWDKKLAEKLVRKHYPGHYSMYFKFRYDIQRCDMVRYCFLHRYGGLYADMDYYCCVPFEDVLFRYRNDFYLVQTPNRSGDYVSNSLMFSKPNHRFWPALLVELEKSQNPPLYYSRHLVIMFTAGPGIVNRVYHRLKKRFNLKSWPSKYFQPYGIADEIMSLNIPGVYTIHASKGCWHSDDTKFINNIVVNWKIFVFIIIVIAGVNITANLFFQNKSIKDKK